tara:strand:- start:271 stop:570 length:300 start_codon:yes stop_codon:yes gene_type:complete
MIDTDKYEGHAEGDWDWDDIDILMDTHGTPIAEMTEGWNTKEATAQLIADAPLLLSEVERLREGRLDLINEVVRIINNKTGERVDADLHDYIIDRLVNE